MIEDWGDRLFAGTWVRGGVSSVVDEGRVNQKKVMWKNLPDTK